MYLYVYVCVRTQIRAYYTMIRIVQIQADAHAHIMPVVAYRCEK